MGNAIDCQHPGLELKAKIDASGFKQTVLAKQLGLSESHFSEILNGKRPFSAAFCLNMERLFGLSAKTWYHKQADYELALAASKGVESIEPEPIEEPEIEVQPEPLGLRIRGKAESYEYRIYELEVDFMMQLAGSPESAAAKEKMESVTANYRRAYPDRPLNPKPRPDDSPSAHVFKPMGPPRKERKPYTKKAKAAAYLPGAAPTERGDAV